nr:hypothetical protein [Candidatus Sigynarchaeota archaeon]
MKISTETPLTGDQLTPASKVHAITAALVDLFRSQASKDKIMAIIGSDDATIDNLIKGAAAFLIVNHFGLEYPGENDDEKHKHLYGEFKSLIGNTIDDETIIQRRIMDYYNNFYELTLNTPAIKVKERKRILIDEFEGDLIEIMRTVPEYYFFDYLEGIIGLNTLEKAIQKKATKGKAQEREKHRGERPFSFGEFRKTIIQFLKVNKLSDLELLYQPIQKISSLVYEENLDNLPVSKRGINAFHEANTLKDAVLNVFKESNEARESLDEIEKRIHAVIYEGLQKQASRSSNEVLYFLQNLLSMKADSIIDILKKNGVDDLTLFSDALTIDYGKIEYRFNEKGIEQRQIEDLLKYEGNMTAFVQLSLDDYKRAQRARGFTLEQVNDITLEHILQDHMGDIDNPALAFIASDLHLSQNELVDLLLMEVSIKTIIKDLGIKSMTSLIMLLKMQEFIKSLTREVFLAILAKITRHIARIIEFFLLIGEVKREMKSSLAKMKVSGGMKPGTLVLYQDGLVDEIRKLQDSVSFILNKDDPYHVNAFVHSKLCELRFEDALKEIKEMGSPMYFGVVDHPIILDDLNIVSEISALDLFFRFQLKYGQ